ncbi:MAG: GTP cyclohydrolase FolE2 [bacterium]
MDEKCNKIPDIQKTESNIRVPIERVGITNFKIPIYICKKGGGYQHTVADIDAFVDLKYKKGINMSRIPIGIQKFINYQLDSNIVENVAEYIRNKSEAEKSRIIYKFPYFINKLAPISKEPGMIHTTVVFDLTKTKDNTEFWLSVETNATSLCPCSKEISEYSAHNQKSSIKIDINPHPTKFIWIEDIIELAERNSSCEIYSVLKRPDEKYVTEKAYENPKFVEDMIRGCYLELEQNEDIRNFRIEVQNFESIHQHHATAIIDSRHN